MLVFGLLSDSHLDGLLNGDERISIYDYLEVLTSEDLDTIINKISERIFDCLRNLQENSNILLVIFKALWEIINKAQISEVHGLLLSKPLLLVIGEYDCDITILKQAVFVLNRLLNELPSVAQNFMIDESLKQPVEIFGKKLLEVGDYECQSSIVELLLRITNENDREQWVEYWFSAHCIFQSMFLDIQPEQFEKTCRSFLNFVNKSDFGKKVYSFVATSIICDRFKLRKPYEADFWVDFNYTTKNISFYCSQLKESEDKCDQVLWELVTLSCDVVQACSLKVAALKKKQELTISLKSSCYELISVPDDLRALFEGKTVKIYFWEFLDIHPHIEFVYEKLYKGCQIVGSQPISLHRKNQRKASNSVEPFSAENADDEQLPASQCRTNKRFLRETKTSQSVAPAYAENVDDIHFVQPTSQCRRNQRFSRERKTSQSVASIIAESADDVQFVQSNLQCITNQSFSTEVKTSRSIAPIYLENVDDVVHFVQPQLTSRTNQGVSTEKKMSQSVTPIYAENVDDMHLLQTSSQLSRGKNPSQSVALIYSEHVDDAHFKQPVAQCWANRSFSKEHKTSTLISPIYEENIDDDYVQHFGSTNSQETSAVKTCYGSRQNSLNCAQSREGISNDYTRICEENQNSHMTEVGPSTRINHKKISQSLVFDVSTVNENDVYVKSDYVREMAPPKSKKSSEASVWDVEHCESNDVENLNNISVQNAAIVNMHIKRKASSSVMIDQKGFVDNEESNFTENIVPSSYKRKNSNATLSEVEICEENGKNSFESISLQIKTASKAMKKSVSQPVLCNMNSKDGIDSISFTKSDKVQKVTPVDNNETSESLVCDVLNFKISGMGKVDDIPLETTSRYETRKRKAEEEVMHNVKNDETHVNDMNNDFVVEKAHSLKKRRSSRLSLSKLIESEEENKEKSREIVSISDQSQTEDLKIDSKENKDINKKFQSKKNTPLISRDPVHIKKSNLKTSLVQKKLNLKKKSTQKKTKSKPTIVSLKKIDQSDSKGEVKGKHKLNLESASEEICLNQVKESIENKQLGEEPTTEEIPPTPDNVTFPKTRFDSGSTREISPSQGNVMFQKHYINDKICTTHVENTNESSSSAIMNDQNLMENIAINEQIFEIENDQREIVNRDVSYNEPLAFENQVVSDVQNDKMSLIPKQSDITGNSKEKSNEEKHHETETSNARNTFSKISINSTVNQISKKSSPIPKLVEKIIQDNTDSYVDKIVDKHGTNEAAPSKTEHEQHNLRMEKLTKKSPTVVFVNSGNLQCNVNDDYDADNFHSTALDFYLNETAEEDQILHFEIKNDDRCHKNDMENLVDLQTEKVSRKVDFLHTPIDFTDPMMELDNLVNQISAKKNKSKDSKINLSRISKNTAMPTTTGKHTSDASMHINKLNNTNAFKKGSSVTDSGIVTNTPNRRKIRLFNPDKAPLCHVDLASPRSKKQFSKEELFSVVIPPGDQLGKEWKTVLPTPQSISKDQINKMKANFAPTVSKQTSLNKDARETQSDLLNVNRDDEADFQISMNKAEKLSKTNSNDSGIDSTSIGKKGSGTCRSQKRKIYSIEDKNVKEGNAAPQRQMNRTAAVAAMKRNKSLAENVDKSVDCYDDFDSDESVYRPPKADKKPFIYKPVKDKKKRSKSLKKFHADTETGSSGRSEISWFARNSTGLFETPKKSYTMWKKDKNETRKKPLPVQVYSHNKNNDKLQKKSVQKSHNKEIESDSQNKLSRKNEKIMKEKQQKVNSNSTKKSLELSDLETYSLTKEKQTNSFSTFNYNKVFNAFDKEVKHLFSVSSHKSFPLEEKSFTQHLHNQRENIYTEENVASENGVEDDTQDFTHGSFQEAEFPEEVYDNNNFVSENSLKKQNSSHHGKRKEAAKKTMALSLKSTLELKNSTSNQSMDSTLSNGLGKCENRTEELSSQKENSVAMMTSRSYKDVIEEEVFNNKTFHRDSGIEATFNLKELSPVEYNILTDEANGKRLHLERYIMEANGSNNTESENCSKEQSAGPSVTDASACSKSLKRKGTEEEDFEIKKSRISDRESFHNQSSKEQHQAIIGSLYKGIAGFNEKNSENRSLHSGIMSNNEKAYGSNFSTAINPVLLSKERQMNTSDQPIFSSLSHEMTKLTKQLVGTIQKYTSDFCSKLTTHRERVIDATQDLAKQDVALLCKDDLLKYQKECRNRRLYLQNSLKKMEVIANEYFEAETKCNKKLERIQKKATEKFSHHVLIAKHKASQMLEKQMMLKLEKHVNTFQMDIG